jgi:PPOX class probable F420-dependent enzyme
MANQVPAFRYLALTTYRRDGRAVTVPVWAAPLEGKLYVVTTGATGKVRRLRNTGRVRFAPCSYNGRRILGEWRDGTGRIVPDRDRRWQEALTALRRKYGWQMWLAMLAFRLRRVYHDRVILEIASAPAS